MQSGKGQQQTKQKVSSMALQKQSSRQDAKQKLTRFGNKEAWQILFRFVLRQNLNYVPQAELTSIQSQPPEGWSYRNVPPCPRGKKN